MAQNLAQEQFCATDCGLHMIGDSRMNIAELNKATIPVLADAIIKAGI